MDPENQTRKAVVAADHAKKPPSADDVLILNVGGEKLMQVTRRMLTCVADSKLAVTYSGRWDDSLSRDKDGNIFVDFKPELFIPLVNFLQLVNASPSTTAVMVPPPMTPKFDNAADEQAFRVMVDALTLTDAFYSYNVYECDESAVNWSRRALTSTIYNGRSCELKSGHQYVIDRPSRSAGDCHDRKIQAFEVTVKNPQTSNNVEVGWMRRGPIHVYHQWSFQTECQKIVMTLSSGRLYMTLPDGVTDFSIPVREITWPDDGETVLRCRKHEDTGDLEWYANNVLVAATGRELEDFDTNHYGKVLRVPWKSIEDETCPYVCPGDGTCWVSGLELET